MTATTNTIPLVLDDRYRNTAMTRWNVDYSKLLAIAMEEDCGPGKESIRVAELYATLSTAPQIVESQKYDDYAPTAGKDYYQGTDIFAFNFRASEELRLYGRVKAQLDKYAKLQAEINLQTLKVKLFNLLNNGFDSGYPIPYDSTELFSTSHTLANGGTGTNRLATDADLSEDTFEALIQLLAETVNEDGVVMSLNPAYLVTAMDQWGDTVRYTRSSTTVDQITAASAGAVQDSGNAINAVAAAYNIMPFNDPHILDPDAVFLTSNESPLRLLFADQGRFHLKESYVDRSNGDWVWPCKMRAATYAATWRGIVGTPGT